MGETKSASKGQVVQPSKFVPRRVAQNTPPIPDIGEMLIWDDGKSIRLLYNDRRAGVVGVEIG